MKQSNVAASMDSKLLADSVEKLFQTISKTFSNSSPAANWPGFFPKGIFLITATFNVGTIGEVSVTISGREAGGDESVAADESSSILARHTLRIECVGSDTCSVDDPAKRLSKLAKDNVWWSNPLPAPVDLKFTGGWPFVEPRAVIPVPAKGKSSVYTVCQGAEEDKGFPYHIKCTCEPLDKKHRADPQIIVVA